MKILLDATNVIALPTGAGRFTYHVISELVAQHPEHSFTVLVQSSLPAEHPLVTLKNIQIARVSAPAIGIKRDVVLSFWLWQHRRDYAIFFSFMPYLPFWFSLPISYITIHDLGYLHFPNFFRRPWHRWYFRFIVARSIARSKHICTVSESTKQDILKQFGVSSSKVSVVYEASTLVLEAASKPDNRGELQAQNRPYILYVGERRPHKNLINLVRAFQKVHAVEPGLDLVLIGKDYASHTETIREEIRKLGLSSVVKILNSVSDVELQNWYVQARALALVSWYEGFGLPLVEAMNFGVPIVASQVFSLPEVAGDAALYVNPGDVEAICKNILKIIQDDACKKDLVIAGKKQIQKFSWSTTAHLVGKVLFGHNAQ